MCFQMVHRVFEFSFSVFLVDGFRFVSVHFNLMEKCVQTLFARDLWLALFRAQINYHLRWFSYFRGFHTWTDWFDEVGELEYVATLFVHGKSKQLCNLNSF